MSIRLKTLNFTFGTDPILNFCIVLTFYRFKKYEAGQLTPPSEIVKETPPEQTSDQTSDHGSMAESSKQSQDAKSVSGTTVAEDVEKDLQGKNIQLHWS